jgi:hypothetical protein
MMVPCTNIPIACFLLLALNATLLTGCTSSGPLGVDPDRGFAGLSAILKDLPEGGSVDVFLVHGSADGPPPSYPIEIGQIKTRLSLIEDVTDPAIELVPVAPTVTMDGVTIFDAHNWDSVRPELTIQHFHTATGDKKVNFYRFEYWQPLAYIKCLYVVAPDTRIEGSSTRSTFCDQHYRTKDGARLSSSPEMGNSGIKIEIMEWGLADAVIATSAFRSILRQAVREAMAHALSDAQKHEGSDSAPVTGSGATEMATEFKNTRFAFISESRSPRHPRRAPSARLFSRMKSRAAARPRPHKSSCAAPPRSTCLRTSSRSCACRN